MKTTITNEVLNIHVSLDGAHPPLPKIGRVLKRAVPPDPTISPAAE